MARKHGVDLSRHSTGYDGEPFEGDLGQQEHTSFAGSSKRPYYVPGARSPFSPPGRAHREGEPLVWEMPDALCSKPASSCSTMRRGGRRCCPHGLRAANPLSAALETSTIHVESPLDPRLIVAAPSWRSAPATESRTRHSLRTHALTDGAFCPYAPTRGAQPRDQPCTTSAHVRRYSGLRRSNIVARIEQALRECGAEILVRADPTTAPFEFTVKTPTGDPARTGLLRLHSQQVPTSWRAGRQAPFPDQIRKRLRSLSPTLFRPSWEKDHVAVWRAPGDGPVRRR